MKNITKLIGIASLSALGACVTTTPEGETALLSEQTLRVVAPGQDLDRVRIQPDGCYWWLHSNAVEDVFVPLLTRDGRMICTRGPGIPVDEIT